MQKMRHIRLGIFIVSIFLINTIAGWCWGGSWLVKINGVSYTTEDFIHWWENYKDKDTPPPDTLEPFIDWLLLVQEAERMRLYETPTYRRRVEVFLKVRSLLLLKGEEVDSKIRITEERIREVYRKDFVPLLHVRAVNFPTREEAMDFLDKMKTSSMEKLVEERFASENNRAFDWGWRRPSQFPEKVREKLVKARKGEIVGPVYWMRKYWLLKVVDRREGSEDDFNKVKEGIKSRLWKREEARLTANLIEGLKKKYHVWVDERLLESLDVEHPRKEDLDRPILRMDNIQLKVKDFLEFVKKEVNFRKKYRFIVGDLEKLKKTVMANIISQTLTSLEALNRHYERKPPLKWIYRFYCQHRLIRELEARLFWPRVKVTEADARDYYEKHKEEFRSSPVVKIAIIQTRDGKLADKIRLALNRGEDFFEVAKKYTFHGVDVKRVPMDHLSGKFREIVSELSPGEIASPVKIDDIVYFLKLLERKAGRQKPFEEVKVYIMERLRKERFSEIRDNYLKRLKELSKIEINEVEWKKLREKLERKNGTKNSS
ncbi:conserved hypothetical protein [Thermosulfidibacter takaii ABI70S6]|uniref:PpiC domain-containing protein n=1 Tax=Thermosulfidibacter takaii (strain DSM 17441 / JCM 13301 / NBRC 103674 / ABI70S6) TaxID=1298851 RepID=A0A0S3QRU0_THET7|nr:peptidylprolyl isomerase [Thermosulfidibacter takaii]BAT71032.1 conserved hypothetical protein [Thermosulfidibacter takaii ABI70S6]